MEGSVRGLKSYGIEFKVRAGRGSRSRSVEPFELDPKNHLVVRVEKNLDPNCEVRGVEKFECSLRFKNLISLSSFPHALKNKISKDCLNPGDQVAG